MVPTEIALPCRRLPRQRLAVLRWIDWLGESRLFRIAVCAFLARGQLYCGDILRHNSSSSSTTSSSSSSSPGATPTPVTSMVTNAQDRLARTTQALAAVKAMQKAAAAAAASGANNLGVNPNNPSQQLPNVPDGLGAGGLQVATDANNNPLLWQGANAPAQSASGSQTTVTVTQNQQQALLQWQTFNIGKNTTLAYDQSAGGDSVGNWIAFNYVRDPRGVPSQILGSIKTVGAPDSTGNPQVGGQVYVMNSNGIIFGGSSQVNAHALVASSLPINYNLVERGLINNPDEQFLFSALTQTGGSTGPTPAFDPTSAAPDGSAPAQTPYAANGSGTVGTAYGAVTVQPGAQLAAPTTADHVGGRIALIGPNVSNAGTISTPDGQTILAAGLQVGLVAHSTSDASLRGLDVYVGKVADASLPNQPAAGTATNDSNVNEVTTSAISVTYADGSTGTIAAGTVIPGLIDAPRGDVFLTGQTVNQLGFINSSTSVAYNGRIDLVASYGAVANPYDTGASPTYPFPFFLTSTGAVNLGPSSVTQILPEWSSSDTVAATALALPSQVNLTGQNIQLQADGGGSGALVWAPSANIAVSAGTWKTITGSINPTTGVSAYGTKQAFVYDSGQITLQDGTAIDVSGSQDVSASVAENIVQVQLLGSQLADSPLQRSGALRGQTIDVDIRQTGTYNGQPWVGTPLADTSGYIGLIQHTVGELTTNGGTVTLTAGGGVDLQTGSNVDVSGGWISYQGGYVQTTQVTSGGHVYDISKATPDRVYDGIYTGTSTSTDPKWGTTQNTANPLPPGTYYESSYVQGGSGGSLAITAPALTVAGGLQGNTVSGALQRNPTPGAATLQSLATAGIDPTVWELSCVTNPSSLILTFEQQYKSPASVNWVEYSPTPPNIIFGSSAGSLADLPDTLALSPGLVSPLGSGFGKLTINNQADDGMVVRGTNGQNAIQYANGSAVADFGTITVPAGVALETAAGSGSSLNFSAGKITVDGSMSAPGGNISLVAYGFSPLLVLNVTTQPEPIPNRGIVEMGAGAILSTAGLTVDDRSSSSTAGSLPLVTNGGSITVQAYSTLLDPGSLIDVSGGVAVSGAGKYTYGNGGALDLEGGKDPGLASLGQDPQIAPDQRGDLELGATLAGYSGATGGSLTLLAPSIQIGGADPNTSTSGSTNILWLPANLPADANLSSNLTGKVAFFDQGGFASYSLTGLGRYDPNNPLGLAQNTASLVIAPNTEIAPVALSWAGLPDANYANTTLLPQGVRAPVNLSFKGSNLIQPINPSLQIPFWVRGDLTMGEGAVIVTDPQTNSAHGVALTGNTVEVLGTVIAPGGTISVKDYAGKAPLSLFGVDQPVATVDLGPTADLSVAGTTVLTPNPLGYRTGSVLPGGTIDIAGNVVAELGAILDVSGATDVLDLPPTESGAASNTSGNGSVMVPTRVDSNGGTIQLAVDDGTLLYSAATLRGYAGGLNVSGGESYAQGGSLTVSSSRFYPQGGSNPSPLDITLSVSATPTTLGAAPVIGQTLTELDAKKNVIPEPVVGQFAAAEFCDQTTGASKGGFNSLTLKGNLQFGSAVTIQAPGSLTVGDGGVISIDPSSAQTVVLAAPYVDLGQPFLLPTPYVANPTYPFLSQTLPGSCPGTLVVEASDLIDAGNLWLQHFGNVTLDAGQGAIRGDGTVDVRGVINLEAGQVYPPTAVNFTISAYDSMNASGKTIAGTGKVVISNPSGILPQTPYSAGGELNIYASEIDQGGVVQAPMGEINLGSSGTVFDLLTGNPVPTTQTLNLLPGSVTSVSAVDPTTGTGLTIPYGINVNGTSWIDPTGTDITTGGISVAGVQGGFKSINLSARSVVVSGGTSNAGVTSAAALIDISGGGDLYAYQFVPGLGGTNDILGATAVGFAVIPGYQPNFAPFAPYGANTHNLGTDAGYVSSGLKVGGRVYLDASSGLPAGYYTLLPARYALLPGAFLITPKSGVPNGATVVQPDGSSLVSGYQFNDLNTASTGTPTFTVFQVDPSTVIRARAEYDNSSGNTFLAQSAQSNNTAVPRLPEDAGQVVLAATQTMTLQGKVNALPQMNSDGTALGLGGWVDITSPQDILIAGPNASLAGSSNELVLDSNELTSIGAANLLIGGQLQSGASGATVNVSTNNLVVDNAGTSLAASDLVLVANGNLTVENNAEMGSAGDAATTAETLNVSGDGVLIRVGSDPAAQVIRSGMTGSKAPDLSVGAGAKIAGASAIFDSSYATSIAPTVDLSGTGAVTFDSGQISIQLAGSGPLRSQTSGKTTNGLVLSGDTLQALQNSAASLSLLSYSSIDIYGSGTIGSPTFANLSLHSPEIFGDGGNVNFSAKNILLDNSSNSPALDNATLPAGSSLSGSLEFDAAKLQLGANSLTVEQYAKLNLSGYSSIVTQGTGAIATQGDLSLITPSLTAKAVAGSGTSTQAINETIAAGGALKAVAPTGTVPATSGSGDLGASLTLVGQSVDVETTISLPSGSIALQANGAASATGGINLGSGSRLDVGGTAKIFNDLTEYADAGQITLTSAQGSVSIADGATMNLSAQSGGGNAGSLTISSPAGSFSLPAGALSGQAGAGGTGGTFSLDVASISGSTVGTSSLAALGGTLSTGGFNQSVSIRVRNNDVDVDGTIIAHTVNISADTGSITVAGNGVIDASGATGGAVDLAATGSVTLQPGSLVSVRAQDYDDAGKGGLVALEAGSSSNGSVTYYSLGSGPQVTLLPGSTVDLSVVNSRALQLDISGSSSIAIPAGLAVTLPTGTPGNDEVTFSSAGTITTPDGVTSPFAAGFTTALAARSMVVLSSPGTIAFAAGGNGGSVPINLPASTSITTRGVTDLTTYNASGTLHLRAPQAVDSNGNPVDVQIGAIGSNIIGASSIVVEGYHLFNAPNGSIDAVENEVQDNAAAFAGGIDSNGNMLPGNTTTIASRLLAGNKDQAALASVLQVEPGAEIVNGKGNLTLNDPWDFASGAVYIGVDPTDGGASDPSLASNWSLSGMTFRYGPNQSPGILTLRAAGNLDFQYDPNSGTFASLSDGFAGMVGGTTGLWGEVLLPAGSQSWSFNLVAGADLSAADTRQVAPLNSLAAGTGSVRLGAGGPNLPSSGDNRSYILPYFFQVIRTGTGDINIAAGRDVQLLNNLATIYTAGTQAPPMASFEPPVLYYGFTGLGSIQEPVFPAQYSYGGGNVVITAQNDIAHLKYDGVTPDSSLELPTNWLYRRGWMDPSGQFGAVISGGGIESTSWWVDFSNFFEGVGALGGGNVTLSAGHNVSNVDAVVPTDARMTGTDAAGNPLTPAAATLVELGGGDLKVQAGNNIDAGVYYVERGQGVLSAVNSIHTNATRTFQATGAAFTLPTTLFLGQGSFEVNAGGDVLLSPVVNPFLLPQGINNSYYDKTYFSTYAIDDTVDIASVSGAVTIEGNSGSGFGPIGNWYQYVLSYASNEAYKTIATTSEPWLRLVESSVSLFEGSSADPQAVGVTALMPPTMRVTAFAGDINIDNHLALWPSPTGTVDLVAGGSINGSSSGALNPAYAWGASINLSDADPAGMPGVANPVSVPDSSLFISDSSTAAVDQSIYARLNESGATSGSNVVLQEQEALHGSTKDAGGVAGPLHVGDTDPVHVYAENGDIADLTLFSGKAAEVVAGQDVIDIGLYIQNIQADDVSVVSAGRDLIAYDPYSPARLAAQIPTTIPAGTGDIEISGPGTLEVLAGRNLTLGTGGPVTGNGTDVGITSVGNARNPLLPFAGADVVAAAGIGPSFGLSASALDYAEFIAEFLDPTTAGTNAVRYLPVLGGLMGFDATKIDDNQVWTEFESLPEQTDAEKEARDQLVLDIFYAVLRDAGRDHNNPDSPGYKNYAAGDEAIKALFPNSPTSTTDVVANPTWIGSLSLASREITTFNGGDISVLDPGGSVTVGLPTNVATPDQGILTEHGGDISIFAQQNISLGRSRIFTLRGGNEIIWSTLGNIAAGSGSKTVHSAPPTRVLIDPQSADVKNDLAGLATGAGIGVLATLAGVAPGDVDLIAPVGTIDAGDAGIRASGNLNLAARIVLNAANIQVGGTSAGTPPPPAAPNLAPLTAASTASAAVTSSATDVAKQEAAATQTQMTEVPSIITVEVVGYGGEDEADSGASGPNI